MYQTINASIMHSVHYNGGLTKILILILEGILKKNFPISVATMSRYTKRSYLNPFSHEFRFS